MGIQFQVLKSVQVVLEQRIFEDDSSMTRDQLISKLSELGVHPNSYSLGTLRNSECVCVVEDGDDWKVYYVERDKPDELTSFNAVEAAYDFVYMTFCQWLGAKAKADDFVESATLCVGVLFWAGVKSVWPVRPESPPHRATTLLG